ncbi:tellurite resistance TerB C-terminal domain-containing protein [Flavobacterium ovatum]|uniref:tellurite resistance TerB C-terminal domain-containing protein n=1 Tax=Flavobacterium ovatum TaxID=1928857 RepID=UPI00344F0398
MKNRRTASIFALFFGGIGIHRFYLGQTVKGVLSILFCWTYIPLLIGIIDSLIFITISDEKFNFKYNTQKKSKRNFLLKEKLKDIKVSQMTLSSKDLNQSNSIINQVTTIIPSDNLKYNIDVPKWKHKYIYSYSEINRASSEQIFFYEIFKDQFLNNVFIDLDGNTNYAFILLFDLLKEYENHKNIGELEEQFKNLGIHYPKTKSYCSSFLVQKTSTIDFGLHLDENSDTIKKPYNNAVFSINTDYENIIKEEKALQNESISNIIDILQNDKISDDFQNIQNDESVIDITNENYKIKKENLLEVLKVPYWKQKYIYYFSEIVRASNEQKQFYSIFKSNFLNGVYLNLEGNTNYAFILLFDLLSEYENHKDIFKLENEGKILGQHYPVTKPYCDSFCKQKREKSNLNTFKNEDVYSYEEYWKLGIKYKEKLKLNEEEIQLLNNIDNPSNRFFDIEYCSLEITKLYISLMSELEIKYIEEGTNLNTEFSTVAKLLTERHLNYDAGTENYNHYLNLAIYEIHTNIFKHCENAVREYYGHKRKLDINIYKKEDTEIIYETKVISKVRKLIVLLISKVSLPDEATEVELYSQNTNRWKIKFEELTTNYNENSREFIDAIYSLAILNEKNPSIENIFFEASKFISKYDKETSLTFYVCYLYYDLESNNFNNKQLPKTIKKTLFNTNEQSLIFENIISGLIEDRNVDKALDLISNVYKVKRKIIQLDRTSIKEVIEQHSETVDLLNEYLKDDLDEEVSVIEFEDVNKHEIKIEIPQMNKELYKSTFIDEIKFTEIHIATLELFAKNNFSISQIDFEIFAKSKGLFKNQLIESINDICYDLLDDVLIEEEDDFYIINTDYFQKISIK